MCGIVGLFDLNGQREIDSNLLAKMADSMVHRGPDGDGFHREPGVGLGHRRLSIIDLAGGAQPIFNEDGSVAVTYNGEIYNFQELTEELIAAGHHFKTRCDTEVIVHAWEEWGDDCVNHFNGMFAFAIWDRNKDVIFLARDRLGIKPLYYGRTTDGFLIFASELKALTCHPQLDRQILPPAVEDFFTFGYVPEPKTIFRDIVKLPPGHCVIISRENELPVPRQYWDISFQPNGVSDRRDLEHEIRERLSVAVRRRLIAEVPLGAFLSGGVDSSAVVAMMADASTEPVNTCSISFGDPAFNESQYATKIAEKFATRHEVRQVDPDDFSLIEKLIDIYDEPYADSSAIPTYRVCELARQKVTVALSGDGGDENFAGYRRYKWHQYEERIRACIPGTIRGPIFGTLGALYPKLDWAPKFLRAKSTLEALGRNSLEAYLHSVSILPNDIRGKLFSESFRTNLQGYRSSEVFVKHVASSPTNDAVSLIQYLDFKTYLPGDILTKVDRASMANSLEVRVPLLDHEFVDWVSGIDVGLKLRNGEGKYVFKTALEPRLPGDILYRPKMGFAVPLIHWFRGPLRDRVRNALLGPTMLDSEIFDERLLRRLVEQHESGARDYSPPIWALMMFEGFLRRQVSPT